MATAPIPFNATQASGLEQIAGAMPARVNAMVEPETGVIRRRPGISAWSDFPSTIPNAADVVGIAPFGDNLVYITDDRKLFAWQAGNLVTSLSDATAATQLDSTTRPQLLSLRDKVVAVGGGLPQKWTGVGLSARLGGSPPRATHICGISSRIVLPLNDTTARFQWSGVGDSFHETWDALEVATAEGKPDALVAMISNNNELFAWGTETLQVYTPDPTVIFSPGRTVPLGLLAPYSPVVLDEQVLGLDREKRFVATDGRAYKDIGGDALGKTLADLSTLTDCWGFRMRLPPWDAVVWMLPTAGKGFVFEQGSESWCEWRAWDDNTWAAPSITSMVPWPEKNLTLVGLSTGQIAKLDFAAHTDLGTIIKVEIRSGFSNRDTDAYKHCECVRLVFKRGQNTTAPTVLLSWRDDLGSFCDPVRVSLGAAGDYVLVAELRSLGTYRRRQWKLEFTDAAELVLVSAEETFSAERN